MDEYSSRRSSGGLVVSRRPSLLRDPAENNRDRNNIPVCSRAGCSSRLNQTKDVPISSPNKAKTQRTPFRSAHGKEIVGSSSKSPASVNTSKKSLCGSKKKISFNLETDSEASSIQDDSEESSDSTPKFGKTQIGTSTPTNKPVKRKTQRLGFGRQDSGTGFSGSFPFKQTTNQGPRNVAATAGRYNLRNLRCNSISDVVSSGCSTPPGRKRIGEPENSLTARGKKMSESAPTLDDRRNDNINRGISISDSRPTRNLNPAGNNEATSVRNRRSTFRTRLLNQDNNRSRLTLVESPLLTPSSPEPEMSVDANPLRSENQLSSQAPSYRATSFNRTGNSIEHMRPNSRSNTPYDVGVSRSFMNRDALRQYGIAEMLLALDRIEQDEEPSYEQLLVLETNLFLGGLGFHDQHRDMRLDIDNMSYEELLALGDRMGTVSTAVPEDALAKCLKKSVFQRTIDCREDVNDVKCSICQEEYAEGDEVGRLDCDHRYHIECVNNWLRLKNWCPICKSPAASSSKPSST